MTSEDSRSPLQEPSEAVCPVCLRNNAPEAAFCANCGAPIGPVANTDPIQQIHSQGFALRSAVNGPHRSHHFLLLVGTWLIMLPMAGSALGMLISGNNLPMNLFYSALLVLSVGALLRTTANYIVRLNAARREGKKPRL